MSCYAQARTLFESRRTLRAMLTRRGYILPDAVLQEMLRDFEARTGGAAATDEDPFPLTIMCTRGDVKRTMDAVGDVLMVFFQDDPAPRKSIGIGPIREYLKLMQAQECTDAIIVVQEGLTSPACSMLKELESRGTRIVAFNTDELQVDIFEHEGVPLHTLLLPEEKDTLLREMHIRHDQLPRMQKQDPMAKYLGLQVDDVVKINRLSMTVAHDIYYRTVVDTEDF